MPIRASEDEEIKTQSSSISKAIIVGAVIIALSNLVGSGIIKPKIGNSAALAPQASSAPAVVGAAAPQAPATPAPPATATLGHLPPKGEKSAKVAVIEFADLRCPFCEQFFSQTENQIIKDYVDNGKVKFAWRQYEFLGPASTTAGNAAECANEQGKFWDFHDYIYKNQPPETDTSMFTTDKLTPIAQSLGMDPTQFKSCLDATKYSQNLTSDQNDGSTAGITGTPSFVIGKLDSSGTKIVKGQLLVGAQPYSAFQAAINSALQ